MPDFFDGQQIPPGYQNSGTVSLDPPTQSAGVLVDNAIVAGSPNAVSGGAVAEAIANFISGGGTNAQVILGDGTKANLSEAISGILAGMELGDGTPVDLSDYITEAQLTAALGLTITAPLTLPAETATRYATYTKSIPRTTFSLSTGNASVSLVAAPAGCNVVIDTNTVAISWVPTFTGAHYVVFWVSNGKAQGQIASLKITAVRGETITPVGDLVQAGSSLAAGMLVNIYDDNGTPKMRPAIATALATKAHAFVTGNAAAGGELVPRYEGINPHFTGLQTGKRYFLSATVPGGISLFGPAQASGHVWQPVGVAISETELLLDIDEEIVLNA